MSWMRYQKRCRTQCGSWVSLFSVSEPASGERRYVIPGGAFHLIPVHRPVETQQAPVPCRFNDWHQFCNTRWSDQFKREIRRIRCTLLIGRKHRLPVISQRREEEKILLPNFQFPRFIGRKKVTRFVPYHPWQVLSDWQKGWNFNVHSVILITQSMRNTPCSVSSDPTITKSVIMCAFCGLYTIQ